MLNVAPKNSSHGVNFAFFYLLILMVTSVLLFMWEASLRLSLSGEDRTLLASYGRFYTPEYANNVNVAQTYKVGIVETQNRSVLEIRSERSLTSRSVGFAPEGAGVSILYYDDAETTVNGRRGRWCRVRYLNHEGWAWGWYLRVQ